MIKAIETRYNGYRFRSRTEARWAVFFDAMKIRYEYEPQGFVVDDMPYLPDFKLYTSPMNEEIWIEVKPHGIEFLDRDVRRWCAFSGKRERILWRRRAVSSDLPLHFILQGTPGDEHIWEPIVRYDETPTVRRIADQSSAWQFWWYLLDPLSFFEMGVDHEIWKAVNKDLYRSYQHARAARFEHGETPSPSLSTTPMFARSETSEQYRHELFFTEIVRSNEWLDGKPYLAGEIDWEKHKEGIPVFHPSLIAAAVSNDVKPFFVFDGDASKGKAWNAMIARRAKVQEGTWESLYAFSDEDHIAAWRDLNILGTDDDPA